MPNCECVSGCPFFNDKMKDKDGLAAIFKKQFCQGNFNNCARHMVFKKLGKPAVPVNLYPNMQDRAKALLAGK